MVLTLFGKILTGVGKTELKSGLGQNFALDFKKKTKPEASLTRKQ